MKLKTLANYLLVIFIYLVFFAFARAIFFISFEDGGYTTTQILKSFLIGARLDLSVSALSFGIVYFLLSAGSIIFKESIIKTSAKIYFGALNFFIFFLIVVEFPFYREYGLRLNHLFFEYLADPRELLATINAFFPLAYAAVIFIAGAFLSLFLTSKTIDKLNLFRREKFFSKIVSIFTVAVLTVIFIRGGVQRRPINWGVAYFSKSNFLNQNTLNGIFNLFHDLRLYLQERKNKITMGNYFSSKKAYRIVKNYNKYDSEVSANPLGIKAEHPNIVLIFMEGFDTTYIGAYGAEKSLSPGFDKLAKEGILFTRFYANGVRTSRALLAGLCSYPVTPGVNLTKKVQAQQFIPSVAYYLKSYNSLFFYGGDKDFEDMRAFFIKSGFDKFYDYKDYTKSTSPHPVGIFDEELFELADKILTETRPPFFATILTLSNHEPFYLPKHFENIMPDSTLEEKMFYYSDWALGKFIERAKEKPYFKNTIFIITADHARYSQKFDKSKFHIPLLIYSPLIEKSTKSDKILSQMNLPMTVFKLAGFSDKITDTTFFAKSVFDDSDIVYVMLDPYFAAITKDYFYRESLSGQFYLFDNSGKEIEDLEKLKPLQDYARANLQISQQLFFDLKINTNWYERDKLFLTAP